MLSGPQEISSPRTVRNARWGSDPDTLNEIRIPKRYAPESRTRSKRTEAVARAPRQTRKNSLIFLSPHGKLLEYLPGYVAPAPKDRLRVKDEIAFLFIIGKNFPEAQEKTARPVPLPPRA